MAWLVTALFAAVLLVLVFVPAHVGDYATDGAFYESHQQGAWLIQHGRLALDRYRGMGPGYDLALALAGFLSGDLFLAARLLSVAAAVATLLLWFGMMRSRGNVRIAFFTVLFAATNASFLRHGSSASDDALSMALQAAALFLLLARRSERAMLGAGVAASLAFLTRFEAVYLLPAGLVATLAGGTLAARRGRAGVFFAAGFLVPLSAWVLYGLVHGAGFPSWLAGPAGGSPLHLQDHLMRDAYQLCGWPLALCSGLGILLGLRDGSLRSLWPWWVAGALGFALELVASSSPHGPLALLPFAAVLAGIAVASPIGELRAGRGRPIPLKPLLAILPLGAALASSVRLQAKQLADLPVEVLDCAGTLHAESRPGDRVLAAHRQLGYHAGVETVEFPPVTTLTELATYAREHGTRWLYYSRAEAEAHPDFETLLDSTATYPGLVMRRATQPHPAVLYEIGPGFGASPGWYTNDTLASLHATRAALALDPDNPQLLVQAGHLAWRLERFTEARRLLELAVRHDPNNIETLLFLGSALVIVGQESRARAVYARVDSLSPGNVQARIGLGGADFFEGQMQEAARIWRPVISQTDNPYMVRHMIQVYQNLGDQEAKAEAIAQLERLTGSQQ